jgi:secondary thiamine-phosphate synthase enzyme
MLYKHQYQFSKRVEMIDITYQIKKDLKESNIKNGIIVVYTPHTTAGITINENADSDVVRDMINSFERAFPTSHPDYRHFEGNSHSHIKSTIFGASQTLITSEGKIILGIWQSVYLCEFDGPRNRTYYVKIIEG